MPKSKKKQLLEKLKKLRKKKDPLTLPLPTELRQRGDIVKWERTEDPHRREI